MIDLKIVEWMSRLIQSLSQSFTSNCGSAYKLVHVVVFPTGMTASTTTTVAGAVAG